MTQGNPNYPGWVAGRLSESLTRDGKSEINQHYPDDAYAVTDPLKCRQSVFNKGMQGKFE